MRRIIALVLVLFLLNGCAQETSKGGGENMKRVLFIVAQENFRDIELTTPKDILEKGGHKVEIASITTEVAIGADGTRITPDLAVREVNPDNYEYIIVIGGPGTPTLGNYPEVLAVLQKAKNVAAICIAPTILAKAGVLNGIRATVFKTEESVKALEDGGATFVDEDLVVDGKLVTANGPQASEKFGQELLRQLE